MGVMVILMEREGGTGRRVMPELKTLIAAEVEATRQELGGGCRRRRLYFQGQLISKAMRENCYHL